MEKYKKLLEGINEFGGWQRLGRAFKTNEGYYFLDTGTGQVFKVKETVYRILDCLIKTNNIDKLDEVSINYAEKEDALNEIYEAFIKKHLFSAPILTNKNVVKDYMGLEEKLRDEMNSITLELTERCNLRCDYCIYKENGDYRSFGNKDMTIETAIKSVDFLMTHSKNSEEVSIGFYGGEPLLKFDLIKEVIEYCNKYYFNKKITYSITSNMTLMTEDMANYFAGIDGLSFVFSLDGPKDIHDSQRKYPNGEGTFNDTTRGMNMFLSACEEINESPRPTTISMVVDTPYSEEKFERINRYIFELKKRYPLNVLISYVSKTPHAEVYKNPNEWEENAWEDKKKINEIYDPMMIWSLKNLNKNDFSFAHFRRGSLLSIHNRLISEAPFESYGLNGCCIPGARRLYINVDGKFMPCERIGTREFIGNVDTGFNIDFIKKEYFDNFAEQEIKYCGNCWAVNLCTNCYMDCFGENGLDFSFRHHMCNHTRKRIIENLAIYHEVMALRPDIIEELNEIEIK